MNLPQLLRPLTRNFSVSVDVRIVGKVLADLAGLLRRKYVKMVSAGEAVNKNKRTGEQNERK
jgi:hypothetical protein